MLYIQNISPIKLTQNINVFLVRIYSTIFIYKSASTKFCKFLLTSIINADHLLNVNHMFPCDRNSPVRKLRSWANEVSENYKACQQAFIITRRTWINTCSQARCELGDRDKTYSDIAWYNLLFKVEAMLKHDMRISKKAEC
jgi:hypothetical protein